LISLNHLRSQKDKKMTSLFQFSEIRPN